MNDAMMIIIMKNCNDFQVHRCIECMKEWEVAKDQGSSRIFCSQQIWGDKKHVSVQLWLAVRYALSQGATSS